jgi:glutathione peroxidase
MSDPVSVRGDKALPLFRHLATPKWNFYKYLINRKGEVVESFSSFTGPDSDSVHEAIEAVLK